MALVGTFPFNSFLSGVLSSVGTAVLAGKCQWSIAICKLACYAHLPTNILRFLNLLERWNTCIEMRPQFLLDTCASIPTRYMCLNLFFVLLIFVIIVYFESVCLRIQVNKENKEFKVKTIFSCLFWFLFWCYEPNSRQPLLNMPKQSKKERKWSSKVLSAYYFLYLIYSYW